MSMVLDGPVKCGPMTAVDLALGVLACRGWRTLGLVLVEVLAGMGNAGDVGMGPGGHVGMVPVAIIMAMVLPMSVSSVVFVFPLLCFVPRSPYCGTFGRIQ